MKTTLFFLVIALSFSTSHAAIFGPDNRQNIPVGSPAQKLARATAIAVLTGNETIKDSKLDIDTQPLSQLICKDEKFTSEPSLSYACTGFLVGPDLLVTAGHCMSNHGEAKDETEGYCPVYDWMFDYQTVNGAVQTKNISMERVYHCKRIIYAIEEDKAPFRDYALIQLDRPVTDREPLKLSTAAVRVTDAMSMVGYPMGLPVKLTNGSKVLVSNPERQSFITNLDAFDGNSGSPVFNSANEVVGILVAGTPSESWYMDPKKSCNVLNRCDDNGKKCVVDGFPPSTFPNFQATGSEVQRIAPILDLIKSL